jgi:hypothetical protein
MANTFTLISSVTVGTAVETLTIDSIPQTYTDLKLVISLRNTLNGDYWFGGLKFNNSSSNFTVKVLQAEGSSVSSQSLSQGGVFGNGPTSTSNTFSNVEIYIPNYTSANYKSYSIDSVAENNATGSILAIHAGLWSDTSAITSLTIYPAYYGTSNIVANTTAYLYGISNS